ncbi:MAG: hypothetical protein M1826_005879 [Phylliscum demangeonii]|nr:MAG: hypothetical protein M1826_005879 [Phylliscum demangeonii]
MSSIRYFNQSAPFWDFVASFEDRAFKDTPPSADKDENEKTAGDDSKDEPQAHAGEGHPHHRRHCGGGFGGGAWQRGGPCGGRRGPRGFGFGSHPGGPWSAHPLAQFLQSQFNATMGAEDDDPEPKDFQPPADVFATPSAYHVHVSLPGAKKEDVGLNYNADKSELTVAGVVYRPGDEEFLKTLAMGERKVGVFERKVRLGNERHPAEIDVDGITAKMEDGVLKIELPRVEKEYVNVKKVDIE